MKGRSVRSANAAGEEAGTRSGMWRDTHVLQVGKGRAGCNGHDASVKCA